MNFSTKITIQKSRNPIQYSSKIVSLGSCFAENMSEKFEYFKFKNSVNPFGIIFNPVSIENLLFRIVNDQKFTADDLFFHNECWHCFEVHSVLNNIQKNELLIHLNQILADSKIQIQQATHCIITYGTSWVYKNKISNAVVANCHKVPQNQFDKEILSVETIEKSILNSIELIAKINPNCHFIFTISPVRHLKDGFVENQRSKAYLITAIHRVLSDSIPKLKLENCSLNYFPAYEIIMDELRDYRFYNDDMMHPSKLAINYIWEQFAQSSIHIDSLAIMDEIDVIQKSLLHKPFNSQSEIFEKFKENLQIKITQIQEKLPEIKF